MLLFKPTLWSQMINCWKWLVKKGFKYFKDLFLYIFKKPLKFNSSVEHHKLNHIFLYLHVTENTQRFYMKDKIFNGII